MTTEHVSMTRDELECIRASIKAGMNDVLEDIDAILSRATPSDETKCCDYPNCPNLSCHCATPSDVALESVTLPAPPYSAQQVLELRNRLDDRLRDDEYAIALAVSMLDYLRDILLLKPSAPRVEYVSVPRDELLECLGMSPADAYKRIAEILSRATPSDPIPMVLHCPSCGLQHIDAPSPGWDNPPHKSHLCHGCGSVWRPADVETTGVERIESQGKNDGLKTITQTMVPHGWIGEVECCDAKGMWLIMSDNCALIPGQKVRIWVDDSMAAPSAPRVVTDGCTESNCRRCLTHPNHRGDMPHAGISDFATSLPAARVPDGWVLVPIKATHEMHLAHKAVWASGTDAVWLAMLAAAPQAGERG